MAIDIKKLKEKLEDKAQKILVDASLCKIDMDRKKLIGMYNGLCCAKEILQEAIDKEEQEQRKQKEALDMIKVVVSGFCSDLCDKK